ncbi:hypothetical protein L6164_035292 [Bauhinia variegata]|uniref:Uncharacterized protein n=1 Tax=Bauhinia variegata TaxID=167791 RepID=A0ACB9KY02_BAUVA|nr:hypothetical protein L6164_035292 [Bauhinia variegata]
MFYSQFILAKKGPLGTIWIAAHLERKLRKNQVADTDIGVSVDSILFPEVPIALRLSSHLLLGVVRIYSRKVNYLFDDCSEALLKIKQAFRSTAVDLPPEESTAPYHSITLPETFDLDDFELPDNDIFQGNYVDHHVSTREQITLQDSMEGVVYTTSQFGLDERFGDGDASQIGLDLDEELLDKAAALEHVGMPDGNRQALPQQESPRQKDERREEVDDFPLATEVSEYAQGPSTPGLEEPSLFSAQEVFNEAEYHNSAELVSMKSTPNVSTARDGGKDASDYSLVQNIKHDGVLALTTEENDCVLVGLHGKGEQLEHLTCMVVNKDQGNGTIYASDLTKKVEDLHDGVPINSEPIVAPSDQSVEKCVASGGGRANETVASPSCSHVTSCLEDSPCKLVSNLDGSQGPESDHHFVDDHTSAKHENQNDIQIARSEGEFYSFGEAKVVSNVLCPLGSPGRPEVVDVEARASKEPREPEALNHITHRVVPPSELLLRPCTSHMSQPDVLSVEGEHCHVTDVSNPALDDHQTKEPSIREEILPDLVKLDEHGSRISSDNESEGVNKSAVSDVLAPEKMLSVVNQFGGEPDDMLMESTPTNQNIDGGNGGVAATKYISGKKRSYAESTLTMQSVDFVGSYGGTQSKRTAEFIPDDDDLLSSILVGRRSSVLKIKPTPGASEVASIKNLRSAPRSIASKRKVLTDDTMVLHGDIIRQQLTNTEDIRRMRKKAPCTRREIFIIQRQFLEDGIFHEPIFAGVSSDLILLRSKTVDLTGITVCDYEVDSTSIEVTHDKEFYSRTNDKEVHRMENSTEPVVVQGDLEVQPAEIPVLLEHHQSEVNFRSHDNDTYGRIDVTSCVEELESCQNAETNFGGGNLEASDAENCCIGTGFELASMNNSVLENSHSVPDDFSASLTLMGSTNDVDGSMDTDILGMSNTQSLSTLPILEDECIENTDDRCRVGSVEIAEHSVEVRTQVQADDSEAANNLYSSFATGSKETDECHNQASINGGLSMHENGNNVSGALNEDESLATGQGHDDKDSKSGCKYGENTRVDCVHYAKELFLNSEENPGCQEAGIQSIVPVEISTTESPWEDHNGENIVVGDDTGFLNVGDDEIIEEDDNDDHVPCAEGTHFESSGWSSRTRAVAKYLQALFDKEDLHGRKNLPLDNILAGKTRKEASRMFFETLVLKTRDYVHVEQPKPFANITIKPQVKLMKSDF